MVGLLLLLGFLGTAIVVAGVRTRRSGGEDPAAAAALLAVLGCGITAAAVEWTWEIPGAFLPVVIVAAVLCGPALAPGRPRREAGSGFCWGRAWWSSAWRAWWRAASRSPATPSCARAARPPPTATCAKAADEARAAAVDPAVGRRTAAPAGADPGGAERSGRGPAGTRRGRSSARREDWRVWLELTRLRAVNGRPRRGAAGAAPHARAARPRPRTYAGVLGLAEPRVARPARAALLVRALASLSGRRTMSRTTVTSHARSSVATAAALCASLVALALAAGVRGGEGAAFVLRRRGRPCATAAGEATAQRDFNRMRSARLGTLGVNFNWGEVEPTQGAARDWAYYDDDGRARGRARPGGHHGRAGRAAPAWAADASAYAPASGGRTHRLQALRAATWCSATAAAARSGAPHRGVPRRPIARLPGLERAELPAALVATGPSRGP